MKKTDIYSCSIIPNLVSMRSNIDYITYFGYIERIDLCSKLEINTKTLQPKLDISYVVGFYNELHPLRLVIKLFEKYDNEVYYLVNNDTTVITYKKDFIFPINMIIIHNENKILFLVNEYYNKFIKMRVEGLLPPGYIARDILYLTLLRRGYITIHSAALSINDREGVLIVAPANTGKTTTVAKLLEHIKNAKFLSEDLTVYGTGGYIYGVPFTSTWQHEAIRVRLGKMFYLVSPFLYFKKPQLSEELIGRILFKPAKIKYTIFLRLSNEDRIIKIKDEENVKKNIKIINRIEFPIYNDKVATIFSHINNINVDRLEEEMIHDLVQHSDTYLVQSQSPFKFYRLVSKIIM